MKKSRLGMLGAGFAMAVAGLMGSAQATQPLTQAQQQTTGQGELKATVEKKRDKGAININALGGLDFNPYMLLATPSPIWFGKSCRSAKTNKQRCSHNAKLKRRRESK